MQRFSFTNWQHFFGKAQEDMNENRGNNGNHSNKHLKENAYSHHGTST